MPVDAEAPKRLNPSGNGTLMNVDVWCFLGAAEGAGGTEMASRCTAMQGAKEGK